MQFISSPGEGPLLPRALPNELKELYDEMFPVYRAGFSCSYDPKGYFENWQTMALLYPLARHYLNKPDLDKPDPQYRLPLAVFRTIEKNHYGDYEDTMNSIYTDHIKRRPNMHAPLIYMVSITRGKTEFFEQLDADDAYVDQKGISVILQEDRFHKIRFCYRENANTYFIFTSKMSFSLARKIIAMLPGLLKWELPTPDYLDIIKAFAGTDADLWYKLIFPIYKKLTTGLERFRARLEQFARDIDVRSIRVYQDNITKYQQNINNYLRQIDIWYDEIRKNQQQLFALENMGGGELQDFVEYVLKHPFVKSFEVVDSRRLRFWVVTPILYYDVDAFKAIERNKENTLYKYPEFFRDMLHKVFIDGKYTIYTETVFMIDFQDGHVAPSHQHHEGTQEAYTKGYAVWQPHIVPQTYHCWGNNLPHINKALKNRKYIEGWEQIIAATQNINLTDTTVVYDFWKRIYDAQKDLFCIQDNENPEIQLSVRDYQKLYEKEQAPEPPPVNTILDNPHDLDEEGVEDGGNLWNDEDTPPRNATPIDNPLFDWAATNEH